MSLRGEIRCVNLYFQVHQPRRLGQFSFFDIGGNRSYFDDGLNQAIMRRVAENCYLPANLLLRRLIRKYPGIRVSFSISGTALSQMESFAPNVIESFRMLSATGAVEFLGETYHHSLSALISGAEFADQVQLHGAKVHKLFGQKPTTYRNTELVYSDEIGAIAGQLGFRGVWAEGVDRMLKGRNPHTLYKHPQANTGVFLRDSRLSDDISFRFSQETWAGWPLTPGKYFKALTTLPAESRLINLGMDYETFGEHQRRDQGIFEFLEGLLVMLGERKTIRMVTSSEALDLFPSPPTIAFPDVVSWADEERDLSAWLGNDMQKDAWDTLLKLAGDIRYINEGAFTNIWRHLQTSDHFYYMSTKSGDDQNIHNYFSPYPSPYDAFMNYMNILTDFDLKVKARKESLARDSTQGLAHPLLEQVIP